MNIHRFRARTVRAVTLFSLIGIVLVIYGLRLFQLQVVQYEDWATRSEQNHLRKRSLEVKRGAITDRNGIELAISVETYTLFLYTREIKSIKETANLLATVLPMTRDEILAKIANRKGYLPILKGIERPIATKVMALNLPGVILEENFRRVYPQNSLGANVLGFCGGDGRGLEGLELSFDRTMRGYPGIGVKEDVSFGEQQRTSALRVIKPPSGGRNLVLTIDSFIQHILETELAKLMDQFKPIDCMAIAMDPFTGEILGMAVLPSYDLNRFADSLPESHRNRPVVDVFEPGSCMKIFAAACGIQSGKISKDTRFYCKGGEELYGKRIKCHGSHALVDIYEAMSESCNSSMVQISKLIEGRQLYRLYRDLGFGEPSGLETPAESQGMLAPPSRWSGLSAASLCIGQEMAITGVQLVRAYSVIANGGWLMKPHLVKEIVSQAGDIRETVQPEAIRRVFSEDLCRSLRNMLIGVVDHGSGQLAKLPDYIIGGKTSTAQKANPSGGYYWDKVVTSFVGIVPAVNPRIVLFVAANEPKGDERILFGGKVAAPVFATIADRILKHLKIPPDKPPPIGVATDTAAAIASSSQPATSTVLPMMALDLAVPPTPPRDPLACLATDTFAQMPDFIGMTLKEVASIARHLDLPVELIGNGIAVEQFPRPGAPVAATPAIRIRFSPRGD